MGGVSIAKENSMDDRLFHSRSELLEKSGAVARQLRVRREAPRRANFQKM